MEDTCCKLGRDLGSIPCPAVVVKRSEVVAMVKRVWKTFLEFWRWIASWWSVPPERPWDHLPEEWLARVADVLDGPDLFVATRVCSRWRKHMDSESRWKALCEREFDGKRQQLDAQLPLYDVEWKKMYCKKPRVRFDGAYKCFDFPSPFLRSKILEANQTSWLKFFEKERKVAYMRSQGRKLSREKARRLSLDQQTTNAKYSTWMRSVTFSFFCSSGVETFIGNFQKVGDKVCASRMLIDTEVKHTDLHRKGTVWEFQPLSIDSIEDLKNNQSNDSER